MITFFLVTYAITWTCFGAAGLLLHTGAANSDQPVAVTALGLLGTFAPSLTALGLSAREGRARHLLSGFGRTPTDARLYIFALAYMAVIKLAVAIAHRASIGSWPTFGKEPWYTIALAIVFSTPVQAGEEIGWRGFALPRLSKHFGLARASLLLGVVWACWHLPLFFIPLSSNYGQSFVVFAAGSVALSVALAWVYARSDGSLLIAMLMHAAVNQTVGIVPSSVPPRSNPFFVNGSLVGWLTDVLLWISAGYLLFRMRSPAPERFRAAHPPD